MLISFKSKKLIFILRSSILKDKDFLFKLNTHVKFIMFVHFMNTVFTKVLIKNEFNVVVQILRKFDIDLIIEVNYENCFQINLSNLVIKSSKKLYFLLILFAVKESLSKSMKTKFFNEVMIYENVHVMKTLTNLINEFSRL